MSDLTLPELISVMGQARSIVDAILAMDPAALEAVIARREKAESERVYQSAPPEARRAESF